MSDAPADPPPGPPRLERQFRPPPALRNFAGPPSEAAKNFGKGGAGCLGLSAAVLFLTGSQYVLLMPGTQLGAGLICWLTAATFAAAAVTAWRGWVWTTLLLAAAALTGPPLVMAAVGRVLALV